MKYLLLALTCIVLVEGTVDPCPQTDHLYYDTSCCETTDCLDSILKTNKVTIDNLVDLKRADGSACTEDDALKYSIDAATNFSGVVCADSGPAVNCVGTWSSYSACANGAKSRTYNASTPASGGGTACPASPESAACNGTIGDDCTQASHCASALCDSGTSKCAAPPTFTLHVDATGYSSADVLTQQECWDERAALLTGVLALKSDTTVTSWTGLAANAAGLANSDSTFPKGCYIKVKDDVTNVYNLYYNLDPTGSDPGVDQWNADQSYIGINN